MTAIGEGLIEDVAAAAHTARERIRSFVVQTPLLQSVSFSERAGANVSFKLENRQETGSFKLRGATNRLLTLGAGQRDSGCVAASSGNHGAAVACAMQKLDINGVIFVPKQTSPAKVEKIRNYGGDVEFFGTDGLDTEEHAREYADAHGMFYLSPYNDAQVVAGQGSCAVELIEQQPDIDAIFVAVGGGGLVGGMGSVLKTHDPSIKVFGCQPAASDVMTQSVAAGEILDLPSEATLSDGTAGGIEVDSITFPLNQAVVDTFVTVTEDEIAVAMREFMSSEGDTIEGAAGVAVAGLLKCAEEVAGLKVVIVICGGNVTKETLDSIQTR